MNLVVRKASLTTLNQSSIPTLIKRLQKSNHATEETPSSCSRSWPSTSRRLFKSHGPHVGELIKGIADEKHPRLVEIALQALASLVRRDDKAVAVDKLRYFEHLSKVAARFLAFAKRPSLCIEVIETIADSLGQTIPEVLVAHVAVLAQFARYAPDAFEHKSDVLMSFLIKDLLMVPTHPLDDEMDTDEEWADETEISDNLRAKILAIKVCRNRSLAHAASQNAVDISTPVLKLLATLLHNGGSILPDSGEDKKVMSRMRLQAAISLLHLSTVTDYVKEIVKRFLKLALVVQDLCYDVRIAFLKKVITLASAQKLPAQYNVIPFLTVHDPEKDVQSMAASYIRGTIDKLPTPKRVQLMEMMFIRLLHFLAHHPDFGTAEDEMYDIAKRSRFLYHLAMKGKTIQDAESQEYTNNLYVISELAQELIKVSAHNRGYSISTYPRKVKLPRDILQALPNVEVSKKCISDEMQAWVKDQFTLSKERERKERGAVKRKAPPKTTNGIAPVKRRRKRHSGRADDESGTEASDQDMNDEEKSSEPAPMDADGEESEGGDGQVALGRGQRSKPRVRKDRIIGWEPAQVPESERPGFLVFDV
ncbi:hypothetical protein C8F01DRAFT_1151285 [Mycena amicta]|nr:hypothetical protein C8F01DRAFT_1151285 [Mycena amicta]